MRERAGGPTAEDAAAAEALSPDERTEMIRGMVAGLAARLEESPDDLDGWLRLARSYEILGERERAEEAVGRAAALNPGDVALQARYASALLDGLGPTDPLPEAAVATYRRVLERDPGHPDALFFTGLSEARASRTEEARAIWTKLLVTWN